MERPISTFDGLKVVEMAPGYLDRHAKAQCPFTYYRPLSGKGHSYCPGSQFWAHPPDLGGRQPPTSEMASAYASRARPCSARATNDFRRTAGDAGSGYGENNRSVSSASWAQADAPSNWRTTYGDLQTTGYLMPRLMAGGAPRDRPGTARKCISESGAPARPMGKHYVGTPRRARPASAGTVPARRAV
mmetsp:Transcript_33051/g.93982  ORF Transcript_33051/g.93982 Transcript_33051/m.93982 type:complete len:188 (+) Transcript_33051:127-690(+)